MIEMDYIHTTFLYAWSSTRPISISNWTMVMDMTNYDKLSMSEGRETYPRGLLLQPTNTYSVWFYKKFSDKKETRSWLI